jgi:PAS domain S-box-containing protein
VSSPGAGHDAASALVGAVGPGSGIGLAVHDEDLRLLLISPSLAELSGIPAHEQLGRRLTESLGGDIGEIAEASLQEVAASGEALLQLEPAVEAGPERGWLISVFPLAHAGRRLIAVVALDVTESRRAQQRLERSESMLATAQRLARVGSWVWHVEQDTWRWSEELFRIAGLHPDERAPNFDRLLDFIPPESAGDVRRVTAAALRDGRPYEVNFPVVPPSGRRRILRGRGVPVRGPDGTVTHVHGFAQDVTELARATARQRAAAVLGRLALSGLPLPALLRRAADAVADELELDYAVVVAPRPGSAQLAVEALSGGLEPVVDGEAIVVEDDTLAAYVMRTGESVVVCDWEDEQRLRVSGLLARFGIRSSAAVAIGPREAPIGVLATHAAEPDRVSDEDVAFMGTVANMIASAARRLQDEEEVAAQSAARGRLVAQALDAEDRARREISEALHDGPLQDLLALGHDVSRIEPAADGDEHHLERVRGALGRAVEQLREVMLDLHPVVLQVGGLESALRAICAQFARDAGYDCDVTIEPEASGLRDELVLSLAREFLRNVAKHAGASRVDVAVTLDEGAVRLEVVDDGAGIPPGRIGQALGLGHIGLASSRERAEAIGGTLRVGPRADGRSGVEAVALLPLPERP